MKKIEEQKYIINTDLQIVIRRLIRFFSLTSFENSRLPVNPTASKVICRILQFVFLTITIICLFQL